MPLGMKAHTIHYAFGKVDSIYSCNPIRLELKGKFSVPLDKFLSLCGITHYFHVYGDICMNRPTVLMVHKVQHIWSGAMHSTSQRWEKNILLVHVCIVLHFISTLVWTPDMHFIEITNCELAWCKPFRGCSRWKHCYGNWQLHSCHCIRRPSKKNKKWKRQIVSDTDDLVSQD